MKVSKHAGKRMRERCGINKAAVDRMAGKALAEGISHKQTKGRVNRWITSLYFLHETANNIKLYGDKAYIFRDETLITVLQVPARLQKDAHHKDDGERRKRQDNGKS